MGLAVIELAAGLLGDLLQALQADIDAHHADYLAIQLQWEGDAGHQYLLAVDVIEVGGEHTGAACVTRAGIPGIVGRAAGAGGGIGEQLLIHHFGFQLAWRALRPIEGEAAFVVAADLALADEQLILAIQGIGLENQVETEQVGVGFQRGAYLAGQVLTQVEGVEEAFLGLFLEEQHLTREALAVLIGIHEVALDADALQLAACRHTQACRVFEHARAGGFHQRRAVRGLIKRCPHQQGHYGQQAEAGE